MKRIGIACINTNRAIGLNNKLLYRIPSELKFFKETTTYSPVKYKPNVVLMGRKTFDSLNQTPLPSRINAVISSNYKQLQSTIEHPQIKFFKDTVSAINHYDCYHYRYNNLFICGGTSIYDYCIQNNLLHYLLVTQIQSPTNNIGDAFFPKFEDNFINIKQDVVLDEPATRIHDNKPVILDYTINTYRCRTNNLDNHFMHSYIPPPYTPAYIDTLKYSGLGARSYSTGIYHKFIQKLKTNESGEHNYLEQLKYVKDVGVLRLTRNGDTLSTFGVNMDFDISRSFPLLTTKKVYWKGVITELLWFLQGRTDAKYLDKQKVRIWNGNSSREFLDKRGLQHLDEGDCGPIYGFQWKHFNADYIDCHQDYSGKGVNQLQNIIDMINLDPTSRRMIMSAWNPCQSDDMCLPPCHVLYQFYVTIDEFDVKHLSCSMYQRSGDMFLGIPFNIASTAALTYILAHMTGCKPDKISIKIGDAHIYEEHIDAVQTQLERSPGTLPTLHILGKPKSNIEDYNTEDFELENYNPQEPITAPMKA